MLKRFLATTAEGVLGIRSPAFLLLVCALWLAVLAGIRPLMLPDEGRYVGVAWEMLTSGDWLTPTLDGLPFFHKPPLFYWLTALALNLFGANGWAARSASTLAAMIAVAALHVFLRRHADKRLANLVVAVLVTQPLFFGGAQFANLDMLVAAMITVTILCGAHAVLSLERGQPYRAALASAYVFAALGVLAKGLIGFVLPGAILLAWLLVGKRYQVIRSLLPLRLIFLFVVLVMPWFWWMEMSHGGFLDYFFVYHHFQRFAESGFNSTKPFWFYVPVLLLGTLPWSPWIYRACSRRFLQEEGQFAIRSLMVIWLLVVLVFFSWPSSKLAGYILPALPPLACLIADVLLVWLDGATRANARACLGASLLAAVILCSGLVVGVALRYPSPSRSLSAQVLPSFRPGDQIVMLDEYQYDLPFSLGAARNPWVVSDWNRSDLFAKDNWRRELYDAGQFDQVKKRERLLFPDELSARVCRYSGGAVWVWGKRGWGSRYPYLRDEAIVFANEEDTLWRLVDLHQNLNYCAEMPNSG
ncbi:MAG: glycosyltransferase family 39 protein [Candidatus Accumulibacter phosphatis]|uniref:ArnT family glycosyltransferase n=1 Tax=Candidatus Accumulibacter phosphatis TaxID=327160 RepID=UPI001A3A54C2|nr:glycosyltransferase family 39 protein [Candidatus Accumulibacter phosphatis]